MHILIHEYTDVFRDHYGLSVVVGSFLVLLVQASVPVGVVAPLGGWRRGRCSWVVAPVSMKKWNGQGISGLIMVWLVLLTGHNNSSRSVPRLRVF